MGAYDGYVAFFGDAMPMRNPIVPPYILRYASAGLRPLREP